MYRLSPGEVDGALATRTAVIDGQQTIQIAIVMTADPSWEKIGQLSRESRPRQRDCGDPPSACVPEGNLLRCHVKTGLAARARLVTA